MKTVGIIISLLLSLMAGMGAVYLQAQAYTDKRVDDTRREVKEDLRDIKDEQQVQREILREIERSLGTIAGSLQRPDRRDGNPGAETPYR